MNENKKGVLANKRKVASLKPSKPRNFVAKNAINAGAGAHKDKKKAMKQGDVKHKKLDYAESLELRLAQKLSEEKIDEFLPVLGAVAGRVAAGVVGAGRAAATAASLAGRAVGSTVGNALDNDEETDEDVDSPEYNDEAGMSYGSLHTIARAADGLLDTIKEGDNLPEWCQEKISLAEDYLITVWDYLQSEKEQGVAEGSLELNTPDPVVVIQDLKGNMLDKLNLSVASQKYKLGNPQDIKNQLAHQNYTTVGSYVIVSPMGGQPQDKTTQGVAEKLNLKAMDTGAVIKDFEKSNAPQFRGKTKEKRRQMAIAAKMGAMKKKKKIGESVDEVWTTDSLASHLFEQELTYEDRLNNMLSKKLSK
jgi:hypothetical protein